MLMDRPIIFGSILFYLIGELVNILFYVIGELIFIGDKLLFFIGVWLM